MGTLIQIDRHKHLAAEPRTGHNRWHPDIPPAVEAAEGEEVVLETRDAIDGYLSPGSTVADFPSLPLGAIHPLTGPVLVKGARPGDLLEVEFVEITPQRSFFNGELAKLEITDVKFTPKKRVYGSHELEGKITNKSAFTAKGVMAIISLYDKADKIVGSAQVPVAGNNLATGTSARFEGKVFDVADTPEKWQVVAVGYSE